MIFFGTFLLESAICDSLARIAYARNSIFMAKYDRQYVPFSHRPRVTNPWKSFKLNTPTRQLSSLEVKILGSFTIIGYTLIHFYSYTLQKVLPDHTDHLTLAASFTRNSTKLVLI